ncbi:MAG: hypothetical protein ACOX74_04255 [Lachnospiraceae bacterium]|jgi:hypothetical protein
MTVYYKFCGGCNPRYDREKAAERIRTQYPEIVLTNDSTAEADASVIICGCTAACAEVSDSYGPYGRFVIWGESALDELDDFLGKILEQTG